MICLLSLLAGCNASEPHVKWASGSAADGVYTNRGMELSFYIPEGWTDCTSETRSAEPETAAYPLLYDVDLRSAEDVGRMFVLHCDLYDPEEKQEKTNDEIHDAVQAALEEKYGADAVSPSEESVALCGISYEAFAVHTEDFAARFCTKRVSQRDLVVIGIFGKTDKYVDYYIRHFTKYEKALPIPIVSSPVQGHGSFARGRVYGGIYTSNYLKLRFEPPEKWIYAFDEELDELMGASFEIIGDDVYGDKTDYAKIYAKQTVIYDMVCASPKGSNVQIVFEDLKKIDGGVSLTAEDYAGIVCSQLQSITDYTYELSDVYTDYLAGTLYTVLDAKVDSNNMQQQFWFLRVDDYMLCITFTNMDGSEIDFQSCFTQIG